MQKNFIDVLDTDDVKSKVAKDAKDDWAQFLRLAPQVADAMQHAASPSDTVDGRDRRLVRRLSEGRVRRLRRPPRRIEGADRLRQPLRGDAGSPRADRAAQRRDQRPAGRSRRRRDQAHDRAPGQGPRVRRRLPDRRSPTDSFPAAARSRAGDVEEERRLFYVAVTRAKNELYISYPKVASRAGPGGMMLTPSRFLDELPEDLVRGATDQTQLRLVICLLFSSGWKQIGLRAMRYTLMVHVRANSIRQSAQKYTSCVSCLLLESSK